jgi:hypothetical protein
MVHSQHLTKIIVRLKHDRCQSASTKIALKVTQYLLYVRSIYLATNGAIIIYVTFRSEIITLSLLPLLL